MSFYDAFKTSYDTPIEVLIYLPGPMDDKGDVIYSTPWLDKAGKSAHVMFYSPKSSVAQQFEKTLTHREKQSEKLSQEERNELFFRRMTTLTAGWYLFNPETEEPLEFSPEEAAKLYRDIQTQFIVVQVAKVLSDDSRFLQFKTSKSA